VDELNRLCLSLSRARPADETSTQDPQSEKENDAERGADVNDIASGQAGPYR
jgi:hypothetical protein